MRRVIASVRAWKLGSSSPPPDAAIFLGQKGRIG